MRRLFDARSFDARSFDGVVLTGELAAPPRQVMGPVTLALASVCRLPVDAVLSRYCMLPALHRHACLPVPAGRGMAVR